jgi:ribosome-associated toxin RatA of RatAB toxin-antitoxin module
MHIPRRHLVVAFIGALALPLVASADDTAASRPGPAAESESQRLVRTHATERYNVAMPGFSIRAGGGMTVVNAPLATVRQTVTDYGHYADFMPRFQKSKIIGKNGPNTFVYLQVSILHGAASVWAVTRFGPPAPEGTGERIEGQLDGKGNVENLRAVWHLTPVDADHTIVKLELLIVPSLPVPGSLVTPELEFASDQAVSATRDRTEARSHQVAQQVDSAAP